MTLFPLLQKGSTEIWVSTENGVPEFPVYGVTASGDPRVCPSIGMALDVAGISGRLAQTVSDILPDELRRV